MFSFLSWGKKDISHNSKKVKKWQKEHQKLGEYAGKIIAAYDKKDLKQTRKLLIKFKDMALAHLMDEDETFFKLLNKAEAKDQHIIDKIKEFRTSFTNVKVVLFTFLTHYTNPQNELDITFKETLDQIILALTDRIGFEEQNLYRLINN